MSDEPAPTRNGRQPSPSSSLLAVALIFGMGVVCGAALLFAGAMLRFEHPFGMAGRLWGRPRGPMERMTRELSLDDDQRRQVQAIIERSRDQIHDVLERSQKEIRSVLRTDQQEKFDRLRSRWPPFPPPPGPGPSQPPPEPPPQ